MTTRRSFRQAHKSGAYAYAKVEEIIHGYATVRLGSNGIGARLTSLPVLGSEVHVNDIVVVDYASGSPPKVRPITYLFTEEVLDLQLAQEPDAATMEDNRDPSGNYVLYIYGTDSQSVGPSGTTIEFDTEDYDTGDLFDVAHPGYITITTPGYYMFIAHVCVTGFPSKPTIEYQSYGVEATTDSVQEMWDWNAYNLRLYLVSSGGAGVFATGVQYATGVGPIICEVMGICVGETDDQISVVAKSSVSTSTVISTGLHPRLAGHRLSRDGRWDNASGSGTSYGGGTQDPPPIDDSDIEIRTNQGYLHVSDTEGAYARAIAQASDWTDEEVTFKIKFNDITHGANFKIWLRSSRDWYASDKPTNGYELSISNTGGYNIAKVVLGTRSILGSYNTAPTLLQQTVKFNADGNSIKAKMWITGETEPSWQLQITNADITTPGDMQLGLYRIIGEHKVYIDDIDLHDAP